MINISSLHKTIIKSKLIDKTLKIHVTYNEYRFVTMFMFNVNQILKKQTSHKAIHVAQ